VKTIIMFFALMTILFASLPGFAASYSFNFGALEEFSTSEEHVSFGTGRNYSLQRREISIPKDYGRLVTITTNNNVTILWFASEDGSIRNVNLDGTTPVIIKRAGALH